MNRIGEYRKKCSISQQELADRLGWSQSRVASYERGVRTPGLSESRELITTFNELEVMCTLDDVFPPKPSEPQAIQAA